MTATVEFFIGEAPFPEGSLVRERPGGAGGMGLHMPNRPYAAPGIPKGRVAPVTGAGYRVPRPHVRPWRNGNPDTTCARRGRARPERVSAHIDADVDVRRRPARDPGIGWHSPQRLVKLSRSPPSEGILDGFTALRTGMLSRGPWRRVTGEQVGRWDVFGGDGAYLGRVEVPASFAIQEISRGQLVGIVRDELDVQRVEIRDLLLMRKSQ